MAKQHLAGIRVAILAADGFEQVELTVPRRKLERHGAETEVISLRPGSIRGMNLMAPGAKVKVDRTLFTADADDYDALLIPGGFMNPDLLRQSRRALDFVRAFDDADKPIASLCHGPWVLISAGLTEGRRLTSWPGIKDDVRNAGGSWHNKSVVHDGNWITSRGPHDLLQFNRAIVEHFSPAMSARERRYPVPTGPLALAGLALAALVFGVRTMRSERFDDGRDEPALRDIPRDHVRHVRPTADSTRTVEVIDYR
jgi:protease I